ncbi:phage terminase small subunit P27 family [Limosilactobacillus fermentum]
MARQVMNSKLQMMLGNPNNKTKKELHRRQKNEQKLAVSAENMEPPAWLSPGAKTEFKRIVGLFEKTEVFNEADISELAVYCDLLMEYKSANMRLKKHGRDNDGKPNPDIRLKMQLSQRLDALARNLGLTPTARASMAINMKGDEASDGEDDFDD